MFIRYTPEELQLLKESPLVVVPPGMPSKESYMGAPPDQARSNNNSNPRNDRNNKNYDGTTTESTRRPTLDRHMSRQSTTNPEDIILGPPKTAFMSASKGFAKGIESSDRPPLRAGDSKDRYSFRRDKEGEDDRLREGRANTTRQPRQADGDDSESGGWSKVKPRKSFGADGAERFTGRMGIQDKKYSHRDDRERERDNRPTTFENFARGVKDGKENEEDRDRDRGDRLGRNGIGRGRAEMTWREREAAKERENDGASAQRNRDSNGDKYADRNRGWREKDRDEVDRDRRPPRNEYNDRNGGGRWGREQQEDRKPEWMDEPKEEKLQARTAEDFEKWKAQMHKDKGTGGATPAADEGRFQADTGASFFGMEKEKSLVEAAAPIETGPDKFFGNWGSKDEIRAEADGELKAEAPARAKTTGKASRFTSFFNPTEEPPRRTTEPPLPVQPPPAGGLAAFFSSQNTQVASSNSGLPLPAPLPPADPGEKEAFNNLLMLFKQSAPSKTTPQPNVAAQPKPPLSDHSQLTSPEPYAQYRQERVEETRPSTRHQQDMMAQRQLAGSQASLRQDQLLQEMIAQRQNSNSQSSSRTDPATNRNNTDFLMNLIQNTKLNPEPRGGEQQYLGRPQQPRLTERQIQQQALEREHMDMARERALREAAEQRLEREQHIDMVRERELRERAEARERERAVAQSQQQQQRRQGPPPGFYEQDPGFQRSHIPQQERQQSGPPLQPTQILQRPPPPGIDPSWDARQQAPQPQHRMNVPPPPGLQNMPPSNGGRGGNMPPQMFPPGFNPNSFPPPEGMPGPGQGLPRGMMQPPPGFFAGPGHQGPPPGFLPPGMNAGGFQGPGMEFGFDGRGMPPQGFRR